jgi:hypothetical protein
MVVFKLFTAATGEIHDSTGADDTKGKTAFALTGATLRYDMDAGPGGDASILMDYRNFSGSGNGVDLQALVPVTNFAGVASDSFVYLYSKFGWTAAQCQQNNNQDSPCMTPDGNGGGGQTISSKNAKTPAGSLNFAADAGFEEWSIRKITRVPLPSTLLLLGIGLAAVAYRRRVSTL